MDVCSLPKCTENKKNHQTSAVILWCFLRAWHFPRALSSWSCPVKIIQWQGRRTVCHLMKTFSCLGNNGTSEKQSTLRSDEQLLQRGRRGLGNLFTADAALRPETCWCPEVAFFSCQRRWVRCEGARTLPLFFWTERHRERILSQGGGTGLSRCSLPEYTQVRHRSLQHFNTPAVLCTVLEGS